MDPYPLYRVSLAADPEPEADTVAYLSNPIADPLVREPAPVLASMPMPVPDPNGTFERKTTSVGSLFRWGFTISSCKAPPF